MFFLGGEEKRKIGASHSNFKIRNRREFGEFHRENYILVLPGKFRCGRWYVKSNLTSGSIFLKSLSSLEHGNQHRIVTNIVATTRRLLQLSESSSRSEFATKLQLGWANKIWVIIFFFCEHFLTATNTPFRDGDS